MPANVIGLPVEFRGLDMAFCCVLGLICGSYFPGIIAIDN